VITIEKMPATLREADPEELVDLASSLFAEDAS
jgi:hypothetical protein